MTNLQDLNKMVLSTPEKNFRAIDYSDDELTHQPFYHQGRPQVLDLEKLESQSAECKV